MIVNNEGQKEIDVPIGYVFKDWFEDGIRCLITKGRFGLCAYVGISENHPIAGFNRADLPLKVNGDLSVSRSGFGEILSKDYYWYGWKYWTRENMTTDINRYNDPSAIPFDISVSKPKIVKPWTVEMVENEIKIAVLDLKQLAIFAEKLILKHKVFLMEKTNEEVVDYLHKQAIHHKANLEYDATDYQKAFRDGLLSAYHEIYAKICEIQTRELSDSDDIGANYILYDSEL